MVVRVFFLLHWRLVSRMAESEADTPSTPIEFESKYFEFDGVRLPPFCRGKMEEIANFSLRSSDIWIVTYPKSGKHGSASPPARCWLAVVLCCLLQRLQLPLWISKLHDIKHIYSQMSHTVGFILQNKQVTQPSSKV